MKKIILTTFAVGGLACGAFAQGSVTAVQTMFNQDGVTTGIGQQNPASATAYYTGSISLEVFIASTASVTANQIAAINALDGTAGGGAAALALLNTDDFSLVSDVNPVGGTPTAGGIAFTVSDGGFNPSTNPNNINLTGPTATGTTEWMAIYAVGVGGADAGWSAVLAYSQLTGGNPFVSPPGVASNMATDPTGQNLDLTANAVPEPGTMALAGLGSLSLFLLRRKK